jgi:hypothetical protein
MIPTQLSGFFIAGTGAAAALLGLLFVAISINPERILATTSADFAVATNTLLALVDAFFVSFGALLSPASCAWLSLVLGLITFVMNLALAYTLLYREKNPELVRRRALLVAAAFVIYALQCWYAVRLLIESGSSAPAYGLAHVLLAVFALGILRAFGLMGARQTGFREWLGPRHYTGDPARKPSTLDGGASAESGSTPVGR